MKITLQKPILTLALAATLAGSFAWSPASYACPDSPLLGGVCIMALPSSWGDFNGTMYSVADGRRVAVSQNAALYSLLGKNFGGDGMTYFNLPDLRGRVVVGAGNNPQIGNFALGQTGGATSVTLTIAQMPTHTHTLAVPVDISKMTAITTLAGLSASVSGSLRLKASSATGNQNNPSGNYLGTTALSTNKIYADSAPTTVIMNAASIDSSSLTVGNFTGTPTTTLGGIASVTGSTGQAGGTTPVPTMMPYQVLTYYIAAQGTYPLHN